MTASLIDMGGSDSFSPLPQNTVELLDSQIDWAVQTVQIDTELGHEQPWQTFLQAMAIAGFKQWLEEGAVAPPSTYPSIEQWSMPPGINFQVKDYQLCIVPMNGMSTEMVEVWVETSPSTATEPSSEKRISEEQATNENALAHFYILVDVQEEVNQVCIVGALARAQLLQKLGSQAIFSTSSLQIPISYFDVMPEQLLLYLSCLAPAPLTQTSAPTSPIEPVKAVTNGLIKTGYWLKNQMDEISEQLSWALLPPMSSAMRPVKDGVENVLEVLARQGVQLPLQAKGAGGPISMGTHTFLVYVWVWSVETEAVPEWVLFFLLGPRVGESLPAGLQLQISDDSTVLTEGAIKQSLPEAYLYAQVQGELQEAFSVCITLPDGSTMTLPTFTFESGDNAVE